MFPNQLVNKLACSGVSRTILKHFFGTVIEEATSLQFDKIKSNKETQNTDSGHSDRTDNFINATQHDTNYVGP